MTTFAFPYVSYLLYVCNAPYRDHTLPLFKQLKILTQNKKYKLQLARIYAQFYK